VFAVRNRPFMHPSPKGEGESNGATGVARYGGAAVKAGVAAHKSARTNVPLGTLDVRRARRAALGRWKASGMESTIVILSTQASDD
jgi:hypothetical protein